MSYTMPRRSTELSSALSDKGQATNPTGSRVTMPLVALSPMPQDYPHAPQKTSQLGIEQSELSESAKLSTEQRGKERGGKLRYPRDRRDSRIPGRFGRPEERAQDHLLLITLVMDGPMRGRTPKNVPKSSGNQGRAKHRTQDVVSRALSLVRGHPRVPGSGGKRPCPRDF